MCRTSLGWESDGSHYYFLTMSLDASATDVVEPIEAGQVVSFRYITNNSGGPPLNPKVSFTITVFLIEHSLVSGLPCVWVFFRAQCNLLMLLQSYLIFLLQSWTIQDIHYQARPTCLEWIPSNVARCAFVFTVDRSQLTLFHLQYCHTNQYGSPSLNEVGKTWRVIRPTLTRLPSGKTLIPCLPRIGTKLAKQNLLAMYVLWKPLEHKHKSKNATTSPYTKGKNRWNDVLPISTWVGRSWKVMHSCTNPTVVKVLA